MQKLRLGKNSGNLPNLYSWLRAKLGFANDLETKRISWNRGSAASVKEKAAYILSPQGNKNWNSDSLGIYVPLKEITHPFPFEAAPRDSQSVVQGSSRKNRHCSLGTISTAPGGWKTPHSHKKTEQFYWQIKGLGSSGRKWSATTSEKSALNISKPPLQLWREKLRSEKWSPMGVCQH